MAKASGKNKSNGVSKRKLLTKENVGAVSIILLALIVTYMTSNNAIKVSDPSASLPSLQTREKNIRRVEWLTDKPFSTFLDIKGVPVVLRNSVAATFPQWTISDIEKHTRNDPMWGFYRSDSGVFGPFYDPSKPMAALSTIRDPETYEKNVSLPKSKIASAMTTANSAPYYALSASMSDIDDGLESKVNIEEMIAMMPSRSSVNLWLGAAGGVTPCHYDGYHNMYAQLSGVKHFVLFPPARRDDVGIFPFLHPSYGQCQMDLREKSDWVRWEDRVEVLLAPGELLYIPPFWIHEVTTVNPSVSVNAWTDISDSAILEKIFRMPVPGLGEAYSFFDSVQFQEDEVRKLDIPIPIALDSKPFEKISCRLIIGALLLLEILQSSAGRDLGIRLLSEVSGRYASLISQGKLASLPDVIAKPLVAFLVQWSPADVRQMRNLRPVWEEWFADAEFHTEVDMYIFDVSEELRRLNDRTREVSLVTYIEFLALQVGGPSRASSFVYLLQLLMQMVTTGRSEGGSITPPPEL